MMLELVLAKALTFKKYVAHVGVFLSTTKVGPVLLELSLSVMDEPIWTGS